MCLTSDSIIHSASAIFVGVYEPTKQKLLKVIPENISAFAHLVSLVIKQVSVIKLHIANMLAKAFFVNLTELSYAVILSVIWKVKNCLVLYAFFFNLLFFLIRMLDKLFFHIPGCLNNCMMV